MTDWAQICTGLLFCAYVGKHQVCFSKSPWHTGLAQWLHVVCFIIVLFQLFFFVEWLGEVALFQYQPSSGHQRVAVLLFRLVSSVNDVKIELSPDLPVPHACGYLFSCHKPSVPSEQIDIGQVTSTSLSLTLLHSSCADFGTKLGKLEIEICVWYVYYPSDTKHLA